MFLLKIVKNTKMLFEFNENYFHIYDFSIKNTNCQQILEIFLKILANIFAIKYFKIFYMIYLILNALRRFLKKIFIISKNI